MAAENDPRLARRPETGTSGAQGNRSPHYPGQRTGPKKSLVPGALKLAVALENPGLTVILLPTPGLRTELPVMECACELTPQRFLEELLCSGKADAAVTLQFL